MSNAETSARGMAISRRRMLQASSLAGVGAFLAACGTSGTGSQSPTSSAAAPTAAPSGTEAPSESATAAAQQTPSAELNFANWPLYIDTDENDSTKHKTLEDFTAKYGTKVNYSEAINDNDQFFGTIKAPLEAGQDTGWDLIVLTSWMAGRLIRLGWVEQIDTANTPNFVANLEDVYKGRDFDPNTDHAAPWQSGMTGLGYDKKVTGSLDSLDALWDAKWKGKVTFLTEMRDSIGLALLKLGRDPANATRDDADAAIAEIQKAVDAGIIRQFTGNEYAESLKSGDVVLSMAWSGDVVQAQLEKNTLEFVIPREGGMLWTDNMLIPKGAAHKYTAELMIDFVYDPTIAAQIEDWVNYICPVKGAKDALVAVDPDVANNPLIFPPADVVARTHQFRTLSEEDETYFNDQFSKVLGQ
ncbi:MAG TPA: spermidine/putrescine ABC transporter substrate-binding protein [Candidatus Limnocylindrales bacterium]